MACQKLITKKLPPIVDERASTIQKYVDNSKS